MGAPAVAEGFVHVDQQEPAVACEVEASVAREGSGGVLGIPDDPGGSGPLGEEGLRLFGGRGGAKGGGRFGGGGPGCGPGRCAAGGEGQDENEGRQAGQLNKLNNENRTGSVISHASIIGGFSEKNMVVRG